MIAREAVLASLSRQLIVLRAASCRMSALYPDLPSDSLEYAIAQVNAACSYLQATLADAGVSL